jgi:hypothetical protein
MNNHSLENPSLSIVKFKIKLNFLKNEIEDIKIIKEESGKIQTIAK